MNTSEALLCAVELPAALLARILGVFSKGKLVVMASCSKEEKLHPLGVVCCGVVQSIC